MTRLQETPGPSDALQFEYDLRPRAVRVRWHLGVASALFVALMVADVLGFGWALDYALLAGVYFAVAGAATWLNLRHRGAALVALGTAGGTSPSLRCPSLWHWRGNRNVALADIRRLAVAPVHGRPVLYIEVLRAPSIMLQLERFATLDEAKRCVDALVFRTRRPLQDLGRDYGVTAFTLACVLLLFALHLARNIGRDQFGSSDFSGSENLLALLQWGALNRALVLDGDWFRLLSLVLVQPHTLALGLNAAALCVLLPGLQRNLGSAAVVLLLLVGAVGSGIGGLSWADGQLALGACGLVYGLIGAVVWLRISQPLRVPPTLWSLPVWLWIAWLVIDVALAVLTPSVGLPLRLLALFCGCACAGVLEQCERYLRRFIPWLALLAAACALVAGVRWAVAVVASPSGESIALQLVESEHASVADANLGAWLLATAADTDAQVLRRVREQFARRLLLSSDMQGEQRDTLATLSYRLGDFASALELEARVQRETPHRAYATQLARFAHALLGAGGGGGGSGAGLADASIARRPDRICVESRTQGSSDIDVLVFDGQTLMGLLQFYSVVERACQGMPQGLPERARLEVGRVAAAWRMGTLNAKYWPADPALLALP